MTTQTRLSEGMIFTVAWSVSTWDGWGKQAECAYTERAM